MRGEGQFKVCALAPPPSPAQPLTGTRTEDRQFKRWRAGNDESDLLSQVKFRSAFFRRMLSSPRGASVITLVESSVVAARHSQRVSGGEVSGAKPAECPVSHLRNCEVSGLLMTWRHARCAAAEKSR